MWAKNYQIWFRRFEDKSKKCALASLFLDHAVVLGYDSIVYVVTARLRRLTRVGD